MTHTTVPHLPMVLWYPDIYPVYQLFPTLHAYSRLEVVLVSSWRDWYLKTVRQDHGSLSAAVEEGDSVAL